MGYKFIIVCVKKFKLAIIISIVVSAIAGIILGMYLNQPLYRSSADFYFRVTSNMIKNSFDENYYYLFYRYFRSQDSNSPDFKWNYFENKIVYEQVYKAVLKEGYSISYEEYRKGISTYFRPSNQYDKITVVYPDKELSEFALKKILAEAQDLFNEDMTERIKIEIEHRSEKIEIISGMIIEQEKIVRDLNDMMETSSENMDKDSHNALILTEEARLKALNDLFIDNNTHLVRLEAVVGFPFWEFYEKSTTVREMGEPVKRGAWGIGFSAFILLCFVWLSVFYVWFGIIKLRGENGKT